MAVTSQGGFLSTLQQQFEALPARSRRMLLFLLVLLGAVWMGGLWWWTSSDLTTQTEDLERRQRTLRNLQQLQLQYVQANAQITEAESRLAALGKQNISSFIETKARDNEVRDQLRGIERGSSETRGRIRETRYRVTIERAPLDKALGFVHDLETSGFLSTETSAIRTSFVSGTRLLSVTLDLIAYELVQEN
jgi:hypothetical protein